MSAGGISEVACRSRQDRHPLQTSRDVFVEISTCTRLGKSSAPPLVRSMMWSTIGLPPVPLPGVVQVIMVHWYLSRLSASSRKGPSTPDCRSRSRGGGRLDAPQFPPRSCNAGLPTVLALRRPRRKNDWNKDAAIRIPLGLLARVRSRLTAVWISTVRSQ